MKLLTSILVATDFSVDGNNAVRRAALLAHEHGARLRILHALNVAGCKPLRDWFSPTLDFDLKAAQARDALRRMAVEISGAYDLTASVEVIVGDPFETLMQASVNRPGIRGGPLV
jgi:nucleotide-binding universal stress UspA family protein